MAKILLSMQALRWRALEEIRQRPGCSSVASIAINRVTDDRAESNWSMCVVSAGADRSKYGGSGSDICPAGPAPRLRSGAGLTGAAATASVDAAREKKGTVMSKREIDANSIFRPSDSPLTEHEKHQIALRKNMERLRAERLAREAANAGHSHKQKDRRSDRRSFR